jgi:hypothetical protein
MFACVVSGLILTWFAGVEYGEQEYRPILSECSAKYNDAVRNLQGCETIAGQCIADVQDAEFYLKRCMAIIEGLKTKH